MTAHYPPSIIPKKKQYGQKRKEAKSYLSKHIGTWRRLAQHCHMTYSSLQCPQLWRHSFADRRMLVERAHQRRLDHSGRWWRQQVSPCQCTWCCHSGRVQHSADGWQGQPDTTVTRWPPHTRPLVECWNLPSSDLHNPNLKTKDWHWRISTQ